jgi:putative SOS response-associated peptidase YedK
MCGRFSVASTKEVILETIPVDIEWEDDFEISYNIAPTQKSIIITNEQPYCVQKYNWGLIPSWSKSSKPSGAMINARSETLYEKPAFKNLITTKRCIVPMDSFYEWKKVGKQKIPYRIKLQQKQIMMLAGIYESCTIEGVQCNTFSIITTLPNKEMATIHNRMPIFLNTKTEIMDWLQNNDQKRIQELIQIPKDNILEMYRVSEKVNTFSNNFASLHDSVLENPTLF